MGGVIQFATLLSIAAGSVVTLLLLAFIVGKLFKNRVVRRRIMIGTVTTSIIGVTGFFGYVAFILGDSFKK